MSSEDKGRTELSYASVREDEYIAPPVENPIPIPVPAPATCCLSSAIALPPLEEISEEPSFICEDLDGLLREADEGRVRDLQEGSSQSVVHSPPRLGSERWRRLNGIHQMQPGPGRREQRATHSHLYLRKDSSRCFGELRVQENQEGLQDLHLALDWEQSIPPFSGEMREFLPACLGNLNWSSREMSLSGCLVESMVSGFTIHLRISLSEVKGEAFMAALGVDRMEDRPVVEMEEETEVADACQEIGLVAFMFFFELLFFYASLKFPSMFPLLTYSHSFFSLSDDYPRHSGQRRSKIQFNYYRKQSKYHFTT